MILCRQQNFCALQVAPLIQKLSQPTQLVLRYLFAFLNHLSEFSDENMMDPYNLAICFGPTLLPIPEGKDQVLQIAFSSCTVKRSSQNLTSTKRGVQLKKIGTTVRYDEVKRKKSCRAPTFRPLPV